MFRTPENICCVPLIYLLYTYVFEDIVVISLNININVFIFLFLFVVYWLKFKFQTMQKASSLAFNLNDLFVENRKIKREITNAFLHWLHSLGETTFMPRRNIFASVRLFLSDPNVDFH